MRNKYLAILLLTFGMLHAQKKEVLDYSQFDASDLKSDLLIKETSPISSLGKKSDTYGMYGFLQTYKELAYNDKTGKFKQLKKLQKICKPINHSNITKIGLLHAEYESLTKESYTNGDVSINGNIITRNNNDYIFKQNSSTIITPLALNKRGLNTTYLLDENFFINNTANKITKIEVDFDNGQGFQELKLNTPIHVRYTTTGQKNIKFIIEFANKHVINRFSNITLDYSNTDLKDQQKMAVTEIISSITPDLSGYNGATSFAGLAEYEVFLGADNVLDKPIFVVDGFDPSDSRNIAAVYNLLSYDNNGTTENLGDKIRAEENFDIVIINLPQYFRMTDGSLQSMANSTDVNIDGVIDTSDYPGSTLVDGGSDFIERNAMIVTDIISTINIQKIGTEGNVVLGPSMGGLITRYALNYMEQQGLNHDTRLWLSFDSPHKGANVPIGFQHLFNYLAYGLDTWVGDFSMEAIRPIVDGMLKSAAARQMLVDHFEPHLASGEIAAFDSSIVLPVAHDFHSVFYNSIEGLTSSGFPETTRNISIINGSGIGNPYYHKNGNPVQPGDKVLDAFLPSVATLTDAYFDVWFTPETNQQAIIDDIWIDAPWICFCDINAEADSKAETYTDGIDAAPGGLFDLGALAASFGGSDPTMDAFFDSLTVDYFNFIPAVSGLALNDTNLDWHQNINLGVTDTPWDGTTTSTSTQTPFVNWFMPDNNEAHVTLTTDNVAFAWEEIVKPLVEFSPKLYLQGASLNPNSGEETLMRDDLRVGGYIPTTSPYADAITCNATVFNTTGADAIVDWIWIELRDENDNTTVMHSQSALLQRDGDVVGVDGISALSFESVARNYYISINHRNHLGVMTASAIALSSAATAVDFTNMTDTDLYDVSGGINYDGTEQITVGAVKTLIAGDASGDGKVGYNNAVSDINTIQLETLLHPDNTTFNAGFSSGFGYYNSDINMDGKVSYSASESDLNQLQLFVLLYPLNTTYNTGYDFIQEQLPQ